MESLLPPAIVICLLKGRTMKRWLLRCCACLLLATTLADVAPVGAATTYTDPQGQFSFYVPDGFAAQNPVPVESLAAFALPAFADAFFAVDVASGTRSSGRVDLDMLIAELLANPGDRTVLGPDGVQSFTLDGAPARRIDFIETNGGVRYRGTIIIALRGDTFLGLLFQARECDFDALTRQTSAVVGSFRFAGSPSFIRQRDTRPPKAEKPTPPRGARVAPVACTPQNVNQRLGAG